MSKSYRAERLPRPIRVLQNMGTRLRYYCYTPIQINEEEHCIVLDRHSLGSDDNTEDYYHFGAGISNDKLRGRL
jgi:hypothetical protein